MRILRLGAAAAVALVLVFALVAHAARPVSALALDTLRFGEPASGSQVATSTSDATVAVSSGAAYEVWCNVATVWLPGTTVSATTGALLQANVPRMVLTGASTSSLAFRTLTGTGTCNVNALR